MLFVALHTKNKCTGYALTRSGKKILMVQINILLTCLKHGHQSYFGQNIFVTISDYGLHFTFGVQMQLS